MPNPQITKSLTLKQVDPESFGYTYTPPLRSKKKKKPRKTGRYG